MSATDANRELLALQSAAVLVAALWLGAFVYKTGFHNIFGDRSPPFCTHNLSIYVHSNHNLHQATGRERGVVDSTHACARQDPTARKTDSLVAHEDAMDLEHHPLQCAQGPKCEPVARGPRGGEERHDEPEGVEEREEDRSHHK